MAKEILSGGERKAIRRDLAARRRSGLAEDDLHLRRSKSAKRERERDLQRRLERMKYGIDKEKLHNAQLRLEELNKKVDCRVPLQEKLKGKSMGEQQLMVEWVYEKIWLTWALRDEPSMHVGHRDRELDDFRSQLAKARPEMEVYLFQSFGKGDEFPRNITIVSKVLSDSGSISFRGY